MTQLHKGHRDRLKERFLLEGLDHFKDHAILEFLLFYAIPRRDTNEISHRLIQQFGSLSGVLDAPVEELCKVEGIGISSATLLAMIPDLCRVYLNDKYSTGELLNTTAKLGEYLRHKFIGRENETIMLLCLDNKCKPLRCEIIGEGTVDTVGVSPRRIVDLAVRVGATSVVLAHNHPKGFAIPSNKDVSMTKTLYQTLIAVGITLLDHVIVAQGDYYSMADAGVMTVVR